MTYILSNNTIFIAGGSEESFYYDINSKEFITWGKMSGVQEQPALIQYGDFLYSFNSFNTNGIYFEKTKLTNPAKKWEKLVFALFFPLKSYFFLNQKMPLPSMVIGALRRRSLVISPVFSCI